jgi:hypothetical protein
MEIKLEFYERDITFLYHSRCPSFVLEQPDRFILFDSGGQASCHPFIKMNSEKNASSLLFCKSFLEAKILMAFYESSEKYSPIMLFDEYDSSDIWVIWINIPFPRK